MAVKSVRLSVGSIFPKGPGKIYFYRYQFDGHRKTVSLQTTNRAEALRKAAVISTGKRSLTLIRQPESLSRQTEYKKTVSLAQKRLVRISGRVKLNTTFLYMRNTFVTSLNICN